MRWCKILVLGVDTSVKSVGGILCMYIMGIVYHWEMDRSRGIILIGLLTRDWLGRICVCGWWDIIYNLYWYKSIKCKVVIWSEKRRLEILSMISYCCMLPWRLSFIINSVWYISSHVFYTQKLLSSKWQNPIDELNTHTQHKTIQYNNNEYRKVSSLNYPQLVWN